MPVAYYDIFRNHIYCPVSIIVTTFPPAKSYCSPIEKSVAPHPHFPVFCCKMIADSTNFSGKEFGFILSGTTRALVVAYVKNLIHTCMKHIGIKHITNFVHNVKNN